MCSLPFVQQVEHETFVCDPQCSTSHRYGQVSFDVMHSQTSGILHCSDGKRQDFNQLLQLNITPNGVLELVNELVS